MSLTVDLAPAPGPVLAHYSQASLTVDAATGPALTFASAATVVDASSGPPAAITVNLVAADTELLGTVTAGIDLDATAAPATGLATGAVGSITLETGGQVGPPGPPGPAGADAQYTHVQNIAATTWFIAHDLGCNPNVSVTDTAGSQVFADEVTYVDPNLVRLTFSVPLAGAAFLS